MTIYTARLDLALALRSPTTGPGDAVPDGPPGARNGPDESGADGEAAGPTGPSTADDAS